MGNTDTIYYAYSDGCFCTILSSMEEIADFIIQEGGKNGNDTYVTDERDNVLVSTFGIFLDKVPAGPAFRRILLEVLQPRQIEFKERFKK